VTDFDDWRLATARPSRSVEGRPLTRCFPEITDALMAVGAIRFAIDGEIVVIRDGRRAFDQLFDVDSSRGAPDSPARD
jgi:hypothetical protein